MILIEIGRERGGAINVYLKRKLVSDAVEIPSSRSDRKLTGVSWLYKRRDEGEVYTLRSAARHQANLF